jgi:WD40-like Beta Propeller Repeat
MGTRNVLAPIFQKVGGMKIRLTIICVLIGTVLCTGLKTSSCIASPDETNLFMGQTPPGDTPLIFMPGSVSTAHHDICLAPSSTGNEVMVTQTDMAWFPFLVLIKCSDGNTIHTEIPSFAGQYRDSYPCYQPGGNRLFFDSNRPDVTGAEPVDGKRIWYVDRTSSGWGDPVYIGDQAHEFRIQACPTVTEKGTLYFHAWIEEDGEMVNADIFRCRLVNGRYGEPENLGPMINSENLEFHPYIAPDESFMVFDAIGRDDGLGGNDLYISYCSEDGMWSPARNLGPVVNTEFSDMKPRMTIDGEYLFFASDRHGRKGQFTEPVDYDRSREMMSAPGNGSQDIYWIEASAVFSLGRD